VTNDKQMDGAHRRMVKKATISPAQPRRAETRLSTIEAAVSEEAKRTLFGTLSL
jgi:hypothetical protein